MPRLIEVARAFVPALFHAGAISVARIETTRPVFLLFGADDSRPLCVAQLGPKDVLEPLHGVLTTLHQRVGDLVPASFACVRWSTGLYVHLQAGLPGVPWFRLPERLRGEEQWAQLEGRALLALERLHAAISQSPEWRSRVNPSESLHRQAELFLARNAGTSSPVIAMLQREQQTLAALKEVDWFWQHGDFCVNNLMVEDTRLGIFDFEEFGATSVPLHDEIGLALSIHQFACARGDWEAAGRHVRVCAKMALQRTPHLSPFVPGLFLHHLVWRIHQCDQRPRRQALRAILAAMLEGFAESPSRFFPDQASAA